MRTCVLLFSIVLLASCSMQQKIHKQAQQLLIKDSSLVEAHVGIAVQDNETGKLLYGYQSDKRFTPASNTKIYSCYTAMKYLPAKLPAAILTDLDTAILITPTGDPSFLHPDFTTHPFFEKLRSINKPIYIHAENWQSAALGDGWSWNDYSEDYMTERSAFPVYGNLIHWYQEKSTKENPTNPNDTVDLFVYSIPEVEWPVNFGKSGNSLRIERDQYRNAFTLFEGKEKSATVSIPFITQGIQTGLRLLKDSMGKEIRLADEQTLKAAKGIKTETVYSQPTDSLLKIMMHRSDNFYADMCLQMVSQQVLKKMDEDAIIAEVLKRDLSGLPQQPRWVDGSGLSRYNQFSPADMLHVLNKLREEQSWERIKTIFPKNGTGTLRAYQSRKDEFIYAKTGSLSGVLCLSGYVLSKKGKWYTFSIMVNNHHGIPAVIRKRMEAFLEKL
ncbi:MAG: D-alanyl-D-alanine carboxypeptidase/D-alanyl-D-alanine-endopeptidase [Bacteroidota bacterium]|jgi:D-alanyl-D-alanine carboxypeptidase/D-alanyl-D-alanine-endopeptidase (penicillin-binding protein 4)